MTRDEVGARLTASYFKFLRPLPLLSSSTSTRFSKVLACISLYSFWLILMDARALKCRLW